MNTNTTKKTIWIKSLLILPMLVALNYSCSREKVLEVSLNKNALENHSTFEESKPEGSYTIITDKVTGDTIRLEISKSFDFFKTPKDYQRNGDTLYLNENTLKEGYNF